VKSRVYRERDFRLHRRTALTRNLLRFAYLEVSVTLRRQGQAQQ
jgi:hypothetical protein